jgi:hypothetical protein
MNELITCMIREEWMLSSNIDNFVKSSYVSICRDSASSFVIATYTSVGLFRQASRALPLELFTKP